MKFINALILCVAALAVPALAQEKPADTNMQILLDKVKADKKTRGCGKHGSDRRRGKSVLADL